MGKEMEFVDGKGDEMKRVKFMFAWYDLWVGVYWNRSFRYLYIFPIPMFGVRVDFSKAQSSID